MIQKLVLKDRGAIKFLLIYNAILNLFFQIYDLLKVNFNIIKSRLICINIFSTVHVEKLQEVIYWWFSSDVIKILKSKLLILQSYSFHIF